MSRQINELVREQGFHEKAVNKLERHFVKQGYEILSNHGRGGPDEDLRMRKDDKVIEIEFESLTGLIKKFEKKQRYVLRNCKHTPDYELWLAIPKMPTNIFQKMIILNMDKEIEEEIMKQIYKDEKKTRTKSEAEENERKMV